MKKKLFSLCFTLAMVSLAYAQPTLTQTTNSPVAGDIFYGHVCDTAPVAVGASGAGVSWNFSALRLQGVDTASFTACGTDPYCDTFTGTNLINPDGAGGNSYFRSDAATLSYTGYYDGSYLERYTVPQDIMYWPMTYLSSHVHTGISMNNFGDTVHYVDSFYCDAWGTLTLPSGTHTNVLRVHLVEKQVDYFPGGSNTGWVNNFFWYKQGFHFPLLVVGVDSAASVPYISFAEYYTLPTTGTITPTGDVLNLNLKPNPARDVLQLSLSGQQAASYTITNTMGAVVLTGETTGNSTMVNISGLVAGTYFLHCYNSSSTVVQRFVKL